ncbi:uncharacterized protein PHALS_03489 [Plasmopara halstedii]|uniref:Uncharacterized protein n=1 Tax=Plasmopara halstedii TaxID=4781 RepID=A0A0P1AYX6_PLAHL|nr:uncharacterized protein PHALS_03489 [Plasmopara halstedii]CEG46809.1 hypothetical protein PHALS_03489 [Plasmopara halstedii]|eukprot:XP_024583178.1 hypothetical protein PHALS_03489 [Plasmopara halstedii]
MVSRFPLKSAIISHYEKVLLMAKTNCVDEADVSMPTLIEGEIGELRKYIVEMMHAETILLESIKLNEHDVARTNARIGYFKDLIAQERARYKLLNERLKSDTNELKTLEMKLVDAEKNNRKFKDNITQHESDVKMLRSRYNQLRAAMLGLRCQILDATTNLGKLSLKRELLVKETQNATIAINECPEPSAQRIDHQTLRAKIKCTQQLIAQIKEENGQLSKRRAQLEDEIHQCEEDTFKLYDSISIKEKETEILFKRLRSNTFCIIKENAKIEGKVKTKRRKCNLKIKNQINTLKRRIFSIKCEVDKGQMTNEDTLSCIGALSTKREDLEQSLIERDEQIAAAEGTVTELSTSIKALGQKREEFDKVHLEEALSAKRDDINAILKRLDDKQEDLKKIDANHSQLNATLTDISTQIITATDAAEKLDIEINSLSKDIEDRKATRRSLMASIDDEKKRNDELQAKHEDSQREKENIAQTHAMLCHQRSSLIESEQKLTSEINAAEVLSQTLWDGIQHGTEYVARLRQTNALFKEKDKCVEFEIRRHEFSLQQECAQEEFQLEADVAALDEKIKLVEHQLRSL